MGFNAQPTPNWSGRGPGRLLFHGLFFALLPDETADAAVQRHLDRYQGEHGLTKLEGQPAHRHVSLHGVGAYSVVDPQVVRKVSEAAALVRSAPFVVSFDRMMSWRGKAQRPFVLTGDEGVIGVRRLCAELAAALRSLGLRLPGSAMQPHMTLFRSQGEMPAQPIEPVRWLAREFVLIDSYVGMRHHAILGRWPLRGSPGSDRVAWWGAKTWPQQ